MKTTLRSNLGTIASGIADAIAWGVEQDAGDIADVARQIVPVDTGALKSSIRLDAAEGAPERQVIAGDPPEIDYAPYVEPDQPFLEPASTVVQPGPGTTEALRRLYQANAL
jgi:hypothetical protein